MSKFACLFTLVSQCLFAANAFSSSSSCSSSKDCCEKCTLGTVGFSGGPPTWYTIDTPVYPNTVLLSKNANIGSRQGKISLKSTGLKINEPGNYSVTFTAILQNNDPEYTALVPVFLVENGVYDPMSTSTVGGVVTLPPGMINTVTATGILEHVKPGTMLTLVATNGGSPEPQPITVIGWGITLFKIPCEPQRSHSM